MKYGMFSLSLLLSAATAMAGEIHTSGLTAGSMDFTAPVVYDRTNLSAAPAGTIVYDNTSGAFFGLLPSGNPTSGDSWLQLGSSAGNGTLNVSSESAASVRLEYAHIGGNGGTDAS